MENESLGILLMDFFEFYGVTMDWHKACVVPARGEIVSKEPMGYTNSNLEEALSIDCMVNPGTPLMSFFVFSVDGICRNCLPVVT